MRALDTDGASRCRADRSGTERSRALDAAIVAVYPILVFIGLRILEARWLALALVTLLGLRFALGSRGVPVQALRSSVVPGALLGVLALAAILWNDARGLLLLPALVNVGLLFSFGRTLFGGPTLVERLARAREPELSDAQVRHCRGVTWMWCAFFVLNGSLALLLALAGDHDRWALYTGFVAYLLMGGLFAGEFAVRAWRFGRYEGTLAEPLLRRLCPRRTRP